MSQQKNNKSKVSSADISPLEIMLHNVLRASGRIVPQTEDEVAQAEAVIDESSVNLPDRLNTPPKGFSNRRESNVTDTSSAPDTPATEGLARAARKGADIPPDILKRMKEDRLKAEDESDSHD